MIEAAPEGIIVYTPEKFLYLNKFAAEKLGFDQESLVGKPVMQFVHPESVPAVIDRIHGPSAPALTGVPLDVRFVARDGTVIVAEIVSVPIAYDGKPALLGLIRDISRRAEAEQALRESEAKFGSAFRNSPHGIGFVSTEGRWLKGNPALCEMLGYSEEELVQRSIADVTHPEDIAIDLTQMKRLADREISTYNRIKRYKHRDGHTIWVSIDASAVHDANGAPLYFIGQIRDITRQRETEEQNLEAQRLAAVAETAIGIAHEMNNVLTILSMNAELLAHDAAPEEIPGIAGEILTASNRIAAIVQRLRDASGLKTVDYLGENKMLDISTKKLAASSKRGK